MAHVKSSGRARQGTPRKGKRLGIKVGGGQPVKTGQIILRQRGSTYHEGKGSKRGKDFTIFATRDGIILFKDQRGKKIVQVV